jgi:hypothetical protein
MTIKHGLRRHPIFTLWANIKSRCKNQNHPKYKDYGGRGISICNEWNDDFKTFYDWCITNGWQQGLEIDRVNNNGNYEPSNCRFVTRTQNMRNTRTTVYATYNGETKPLHQWCDDLGLNFSRTVQRIEKLKMPVEMAFAKEKLKRRFHSAA